VIRFVNDSDFSEMLTAFRGQCFEILRSGNRDRWWVSPRKGEGMVLPHDMHLRAHRREGIRVRSRRALIVEMASVDLRFLSFRIFHLGLIIKESPREEAHFSVMKFWCVDDRSRFVVFRSVTSGRLSRGTFHEFCHGHRGFPCAQTFARRSCETAWEISAAYFGSAVRLTFPENDSTETYAELGNMVISEAKVFSAGYCLSDSRFLNFPTGGE
jgi:hypothetical protein